MISGFLRKILKSDEAEKQANILKKVIKTEASQTTIKLDRMNVALKKSQTYYIAKAMGKI